MLWTTFIREKSFLIWVKEGVLEVVEWT